MKHDMLQSELRLADLRRLESQRYTGWERAGFLALLVLAVAFGIGVALLWEWARHG